MNCCNYTYYVGCYKSCKCVDTGLQITDLGNYVVEYWYAGADVLFKLTIPNSGATTLKLPNIFNSSTIFFKLYNPSGFLVTMPGIYFDPAAGGAIQVAYDCFAFENKALIENQVRNECQPVPCSDCSFNHGFTSPSTINISVTPTEQCKLNIIGFTKESCCQNIVLQNLTATYLGAQIQPPLLYTPMANYNLGFPFCVANVASVAPVQVGDTIEILLSFVCLSKKGVDNNDCISAIQTITITVTII